MSLLYLYTLQKYVANKKDLILECNLLLFNIKRIITVLWCKSAIIINIPKMTYSCILCNKGKFQISFLVVLLLIPSKMSTRPTVSGFILILDKILIDSKLYFMYFKSSNFVSKTFNHFLFYCKISIFNHKDR